MFLKQQKKSHGSGLMVDKLGSSGSVYYQPTDSEIGNRYSRGVDYSNSHLEDFERNGSDNMTNDKYSSSMKNSTLIDPREIAD